MDHDAHVTSDAGRSALEDSTLHVVLDAQPVTLATGTTDATTEGGRGLAPGASTAAEVPHEDTRTAATAPPTHAWRQRIAAEVAELQSVTRRAPTTPALPESHITTVDPDAPAAHTYLRDTAAEEAAL